MKKMITLLCATVFVVGIKAQTAEVYDPFFMDGPINTLGWTTHSGTAGQIMVSGMEASLLSSNTEDVNAAFGNAYAIQDGYISKVSYSVTVQAVNPIGLSTSPNGAYFMALGATSGTSVNTMVARLFVKAGTTGAVFGVLSNTGGTGTVSWLPTEINYGTNAILEVVYEVKKDGAGNVISQVATLQYGSNGMVSNSDGTSAPPASIASLVIREASGTGNLKIQGGLAAISYTPVLLGVKDVAQLKKNFVQNTQVEDVINFGTEADVKIYNMAGQVVGSSHVNKNESMEVNHLVPGVYIVSGLVDGELVSERILKK